MTLATDVPNILGALIPLVIVAGIFVVRPFAHRDGRRAWAEAIGRREEFGQTQERMLHELEAIRTRLDNIERVLSSVD